jgi:hypothetical protein
MINVFINSLLVFFTAVFLIEGIIFLFRIPQGSVAAFLRTVPIFKLPFDLCLYDFSRWSYPKGINPFDCAEGTRTLSIMIGRLNEETDWLFLPINSGIQFTVPGNLTFTLADILGYSIESKALNIFTLFFIITSVVLLSRKLIHYYQSISSLHALAKTAHSTPRKTRNCTLASYLKNYPWPILTSSTLKGSPFVAGFISYKVYLPERY